MKYEESKERYVGMVSSLGALDLAQDDLDRIERIKEDLSAAVADMVKYSDDEKEARYAAECIEELFDELYHKKWARLFKVAHESEWAEGIPTFRSISAALDAKRKYASSKRKMGEIIRKLENSGKMVTVVFADGQSHLNPRLDGELV